VTLNEQSLVCEEPEFQSPRVIQAGCLWMPIMINRHPGGREGCRGNKKDPELNSRRVFVDKQMCTTIMDSVE